MAKSLAVAVCVAWQFFRQPGPGIFNDALLLTGDGCSGGNPVSGGAVAVTTTVTVAAEVRVVVVVPLTVVTAVRDWGMVPRLTVQTWGTVAEQQLPPEQELAPPGAVIEEIVEFGESVSVRTAPLTGSPWL